MSEAWTFEFERGGMSEPRTYSAGVSGCSASPRSKRSRAERRRPRSRPVRAKTRCLFGTGFWPLRRGCRNCGILLGDVRGPDISIRARFDDVRASDVIGPLQRNRFLSGTGFPQARPRLFRRQRPVLDRELGLTAASHDVALGGSATHSPRALAGRSGEHARQCQLAELSGRQKLNPPHAHGAQGRPSASSSQLSLLSPLSLSLGAKRASQRGGQLSLLSPLSLSPVSIRTI
jgi:hypothetical protein